MALRTRSALIAAARPDAPRRIRHEARDHISAAGLSLAASIGTTAVLWAVIRWLG